MDFVVFSKKKGEVFTRIGRYFCPKLREEKKSPRIPIDIVVFSKKQIKRNLRTRIRNSQYRVSA